MAIKKSCLERVYTDYTRVSATNSGTNVSYSEEIKRFFDPSDDQARNDLANSRGAAYLGELADFMTSALYPADGSWVEAMISPQSDIQTTQTLMQVTEVMRKALAKSNFYGKMNELIINGLLYNKGLMSVEYSGGLNFCVYDPKDTHMSENVDEWASRTYSQQQVTNTDLMSLFKNAPKVLEKEMIEGDIEGKHTIIHAIVPNTKLWVEGLEVDPKYKFVKLTLLKDYSSPDLITLLEPNTGFQNSGYTQCPMLQYKTGHKQSLCKRALPDAVIVNRYEMSILERAELATRPPLAAPASLENRGVYSIKPGDIIPLNPGEAPPTPINTTIDLNVSEHTVSRKEAQLREMFKIDLINQTKLLGISQYEHHGMKYNALKSIQPLACLLTGRTTEALLQRVHALLMENDPRYMELMAGLSQTTQGQYHFDNLRRMMEKSNRLANAGRAAQAIQAYASFNPNSAQIINAEAAVTQILIDSELPQLVKSQQEVSAEREGFNQAAQQQEQQAMQMEQAKLQPANDKNQLGAAELALKAQQGQGSGGG